MFINWEPTLYIDPKDLTPAEHGIPVLSYGNYGGPGYSAGTVGGETPAALPVSPDPLAPVDALDTAFYFHDRIYQASTDPAALRQADIALVTEITSLDLVDPEAALYGGFASLALIGQLVVTDTVEPTDPFVRVAVGDAVENVSTGIDALSHELFGLPSMLYSFGAARADLFL